MPKQENSGISKFPEKRATSRGEPKFSKRICGKFLFHSILNRDFRKFWSNGTRPEFPFLNYKKWHLRKLRKIKAKDTMKNNFKTRNLIVSSPGDPKRPVWWNSGKAEWREEKPNPKKNGKPSEIRVLKDQWNDGKSSDILKDGSLTRKPFVLGENFRQLTKIENLIDAFKSVHLHACQGYACVQARLQFLGRSFIEVEIGRLPHSWEDVVEVCPDC